MPESGPPRLLYCVNVGWFFLSHRLPLALAAQAAGYEVHVACGVESEDEVTRIRSHGFVFHRLPLERGGTRLLAEVRALGSIFSVIRQVRPAVLHSVTAKPIIYAGLAGRLCGVPARVGALTGLGYLFTHVDRHRLLRRLVAAALRLGLAGRNSRLILQNPGDAGTLIAAGAVDREQVVVLPGSGVDTQIFLPVAEPTGTPLVVLPARMLRDKGVVEFCAAAAQVKEAGVEARFALVGGEDARNPAAIPRGELEALCARSGVEWWGHRDDMPQVLAQASVVCLPSFREGMPKALIEASAVGRAIVTTDVPGCRDVIDRNGGGVLVPARDAAALAVALQALLVDPARRQAMGRVARRRAEQVLDVRIIVRQTLDLYADLLAAAGLPTPKASSTRP